MSTPNPNPKLRNQGKSHAERGTVPRKGYLAACKRCGQVVVHWKGGRVNHAHWYSFKCRSKGE